MQKTTVYVPLEVKRALGRSARARDTSEAERIREALRNIVAEVPAPRPRLPLIESGKPLLAERHGTTELLTLDLRHFQALRVGGRKRLRIYPVDA
jgi:hypothetical protein